MKSTGAFKSPIDVRNFAYIPKYKNAPNEVGKRWPKLAIRDQHRVGICTTIAVVQQAIRAFDIEFSPDASHLLQKKFIDKNWHEGSSALSSLKTGTHFGFVPKYLVDPYITENDRKLGWTYYSKKLQAIPDEVINEWITVASKYKMAGYYRVPLHWQTIKNAILESKFGLIVRFSLDDRWWRDPIEPLRSPIEPLSGHIVSISRAVGHSYRVENSWGTDWADEGSAYGMFTDYKPTEAWLPVFPDPTDPLHVDVITQIEKKKKLMGNIIELMQKIINILLYKKGV